MRTAEALQLPLYQTQEPLGQRKNLRRVKIHKARKPVILTIPQTSIEIPQKTSDRGIPCISKYFKITCKCGTRVVRKGCRNRACPDCAKDVGKRRARRALKRLQDGRKAANGRLKPVIYTVITIPEHLRARYADPKEFR